MDTSLPSIEQILIAKGFAVEEAKRKVAELASKFPGGIPATILEQWIDATFSADTIRGVLLECGRAWEKLARTGRGPVAHDSSELA